MMEEEDQIRGNDFLWGGGVLTSSLQPHHYIHFKRFFPQESCKNLISINIVFIKYTESIFQSVLNTGSLLQRPSVKRPTEEET